MKWLLTASIDVQPNFNFWVLSDSFRPGLCSSFFGHVGKKTFPQAFESMSDKNVAKTA